MRYFSKSLVAAVVGRSCLLGSADAGYFTPAGRTG